MELLSWLLSALAHLSLGDVLLQARGGNAIAQFLNNLYTDILRPIALAAAVLFGAFGGLQIVMGRREGVEKVLLAVIGLFIILAANPLFALIRSAIPGRR